MAEAPSVQQLLDYQRTHTLQLIAGRSESPTKSKVTPRLKQVRYSQNQGKIFPGPSVTPDASINAPTKQLLYYRKDNPGKLLTGPTENVETRKPDVSPVQSKKEDAPKIRVTLSVPPTPQISPGAKDREIFKKSGVFLKPQQIPIWSAAKPDSILLYKPVKGDDLDKLKNVAGAIGEWYKGNSQISAITTLDKRPKPLQSWKEDDPHGLSVLFIPKGVLNLKIDARHRNRYLDFEMVYTIVVKAKQSMRVETLKKEIEKMEGFPIQQQDLLFKNCCLRNEERLYTYRLNDIEPIQLILQPRFDLSLTVQTFWKKDYTLQLDKCIQVKEILGAILWELFIDKGSKQTLFLVQSLVRQSILCLEYEGKILPNSENIMLHQLQNGSFLNLWPVTKDSKLMSQAVEIKMDYEGRHKFKVPAAPSDTWIIVAMKAFKFTRIPLDMMKLISKTGPVDFNSPIGFNKTNKHQVTIIVNEDFNRRRYELHQLAIKYPSGVKKRLHFNANDTVADIKHYLACMGFHPAKYYTFFVGDKPLEDKTVISGLNLKKRQTVDLELETFPFFVHLQGKEFTLLEEHQLTALVNLQNGVLQQINTEKDTNNVLVYSGQVLPNDTTLLHQTAIVANSVFFIENIPSHHSIEFKRQDNKIFYLSIQRPANGEAIWDIVKNCKYLYDNSRYAVVLLLNWLLTPRPEKEDSSIMLQDPRPKPCRKDPIKPKQIKHKVWIVYATEFANTKQSNKRKEILDSDGQPRLQDPDEEIQNRKLKEWPFDTVQPRWVKFPAIPSQTGSSTNDKKTIKDEEKAKQLVEEQKKKRRKVRGYDKSLQVDMDKYEEQENRRAMKKKKIEEDQEPGQTIQLFRTREEREVFERAQLEAQGLLEEEEEEKEGEGEEEKEGDGVDKKEEDGEGKKEDGEEKEEDGEEGKDEANEKEAPAEVGEKEPGPPPEDALSGFGARSQMMSIGELDEEDAKKQAEVAEEEGSQSGAAQKEGSQVNGAEGNNPQVNGAKENGSQVSGPKEGDDKKEGSVVNEEEGPREATPPKERQVDESGREAPKTDGRPEPREPRQRGTAGGRQAPQTAGKSSGRESGQRDAPSGRKAPQASKADSTAGGKSTPAGRQAPPSSRKAGSTVAGEQNGPAERKAPQSSKKAGSTVAGGNDSQVGEEPPQNGKKKQVKFAEEPREEDETGRQAPKQDGKPGERKPQEKKGRQAPRDQRGEDIKREQQEGEDDDDDDDDEAEAPPGSLLLPRKSVSADTLLALQKKLRKRRKTLGLVFNTTELTEDVGKEYEQKDRMVVDRCQVTSEDDKTSFVKILYPRRVRVAILEPLDDEDEPAKQKKSKKDLKVKFEDEEKENEEKEKNGYWKPVLQIVNFHDYPIWEYRPTFQEQLEAKEKAANTLEKERAHEEYLQKKWEEEEKKEAARKEKKIKEMKDIPKENKVGYELLSEAKEYDAKKHTGEDNRATPASRTKPEETPDEDVMVTLASPGQLGYKQRKENEKRQWMDIEEMPKYDRRQAREKRQEKATPKGSSRSRKSNSQHSQTNGKVPSPGEKGRSEDGDELSKTPPENHSNNAMTN